jgi:hypothetical protein
MDYFKIYLNLFLKNIELNIFFFFFFKNIFIENLNLLQINF